MKLFKAWKNPFKRRLNDEPKIVKTLNIRAVRNQYATGPLKVYRAEVIIEVNGQRIGKFPLTMKAYSKAHLHTVLSEKSRLVIASNPIEVKTNPNGKGRLPK